ncbi:MAG: hypothetical protein ABSF62_02345 [Bryobacteraceae bacterium]
MALVSDFIARSFIHLGVVAVGETLPTALQTDAFAQLNPLLDSLSAEDLVVPNQVEQTFSLSSGVTAYTLGSGGSFATTGSLRALKATTWRGISAFMTRGGRVLSLAEFGEALPAAQDALMAQFAKAAAEGVITAIPNPLVTTVPTIVGADTNYPLINVRVFPAPSLGGGSLELGYTTPITNFSTVGDTISLPQGWILMLEWNLAKLLYPTYPSPSRQQLIFSMAQETKAALIAQNAMSAPTNPQPAAPQGQK